MNRDDALLDAFAAELRAQRVALGYSQEELADRAGINRTYIAKLELAKNQPTLSVLNSLAGALDNELPELLRLPTGTSIGTRLRRIGEGCLHSTGTVHSSSERLSGHQERRMLRDLLFIDMLKDDTPQSPSRR